MAISVLKTLHTLSYLVSVTGVCVCAQLCPTLFTSMDYSPSGSSVHGVFQARILELIAISSFRGSFWPRDQTHISCGSSIGSQVLYHWATLEACHRCEIGFIFISVVQVRKLILWEISHLSRVTQPVSSRTSSPHHFMRKKAVEKREGDQGSRQDTCSVLRADWRVRSQDGTTSHPQLRKDCSMPLGFSIIYSHCHHDDYSLPL